MHPGFSCRAKAQTAGSPGWQPSTEAGEGQLPERHSSTRWSGADFEAFAYQGPKRQGVTGVIAQGLGNNLDVLVRLGSPGLRPAVEEGQATARHRLCVCSCQQFCMTSTGAQAAGRRGRAGDVPGSMAVIEDMERLRCPTLAHTCIRCAAGPNSAA